jgi:hypothetical protein
MACTRPVRRLHRRRRIRRSVARRPQPPLAATEGRLEALLLRRDWSDPGLLVSTVAIPGDMTFRRLRESGLVPTQEGRRLPATPFLAVRQRGVAEHITRRPRPTNATHAAGPRGTTSTTPRAYSSSSRGVAERGRRHARIFCFYNPRWSRCNSSAKQHGAEHSPGRTHSRQLKHNITVTVKMR